MREESRLWFRQAEEDAITAEQNIKIERFYASAFFSQQAAEKALKALYLERNREPYLSHNLVELAKFLKAPEDILTSCRALAPQYTVTRYPDAAGGLPYDAYDKYLANELLKNAKKVLAWVKISL